MRGIAISTGLGIMLAAVSSSAIGDLPKLRTSVLKTPTESRPVLNASQLAGLFHEAVPTTVGNEDFAASEDGLLDLATAKAYKQVAPSVVFVTDGRTGHGTGFFIDPAGWILTNHHVISEMPYDAESGHQVARIVYGTLDAEGVMRPVNGYLEAIVYHADAVRDLAILKLKGLPPGKKSVPALKVATKNAVPGDSCVAIGHPSRGVLWTLRHGEVSGIGHFPQDQIENQLLGTEPDVAKAAAERWKKAPSCQVLLSTCGLNPGDSGGPLVNEAGELVAVSFAVPMIDEAAGVDLGKFSYHVHADEVRAFLKDRPETPDIVLPPHLPTARIQILTDMDKDGTNDAIAYLISRTGPPTGLLIDLDQDSQADTVQASYDAGTLDPESDWDYEFALTLGPMPVIFLDRNNDRELDYALILSDEQSWVMERTDTGWTRKKAATGIPDAPYKDKNLNEKFSAMVKVLFQ